LIAAARILFSKADKSATAGWNFQYELGGWGFASGAITPLRLYVSGTGVIWDVCRLRGKFRLIAHGVKLFGTLQYSVRQTGWLDPGKIILFGGTNP